ncbi:MAG: nucleotidyltransferase family protein [Candidatus Rokuibacteriota bacterium]
MIAAVVLAAGLSTRMGRQKLLLPLGDKPVVRWSVEAVLPHVQDVVVVTGRETAAVRDALAGLSVRFAENPSPEAGQSSSIGVGVAALPPAARAALIVLGDQPRTPRSVVPALLAARDRTGKAVIVPVYRGVRGTPVLFGAEVFAELRALSGDAGARAVVAARPERVEAVEVDSPMPVDVDTPEDLARVHVE